MTTNCPEGVAWPQESSKTTSQVDSVTAEAEAHILGLGNMATIQGSYRVLQHRVAYHSTLKVYGFSKAIFQCIW